MGVLESSPYYCVLSWYVYFSFLYIIILLPRLIAPVFPVSMTLIVYYLTCMYNYSICYYFGLIDCNSLLCTFSVVYCNFCICWSALLSLGLACCIVWSGGISSVSPVIELAYFLFYLLLWRCRCLFFLIPCCDVCSIYPWYFGVLVYVTCGSLCIIISTVLECWWFTALFILHQLSMVHCTFWFTGGCLVVAYYCVEVSFVAFVLLLCLFFCVQNFFYVCVPPVFFVVENWCISLWLLLKDS